MSAGWWVCEFDFADLVAATAPARPISRHYGERPGPYEKRAFAWSVIGRLIWRYPGRTFTVRYAAAESNG